jgi:hypothetical protein
VKTLFYSAILFLLLINCKKDEEMLTGDIIGKITAYDQYMAVMPDQKDITVRLYQDTALLESTLTDEHGQYLFQALKYGRYNITVEKEHFVPTWGKYHFNHVGGYSPTISNYILWEIPTCELQLDSVTYNDYYNMVFINLKFNGDTALPPNSYGLGCRIFAGNSAEVSRENYISQGKGYISDYSLTEYGKKSAAYASFYEYNMDQNFGQLKNGPIYIRLYPIAEGQGYWITDYYPEALGNPSDVISFKWNDIVPGF